MSIVNPLRENENVGIPAGSLLEFLYTYHTPEQLNTLLNTDPTQETLEAWGVSSDHYHPIVLAAIRLIAND